MLLSLDLQLLAEGQGPGAGLCTLCRCCIEAGMSWCHLHQGLFLADTESERQSPSPSSLFLLTPSLHSRRYQSLVDNSRTEGRYPESSWTHRYQAGRRSPPHIYGRTCSGLTSQVGSSSLQDSLLRPWRLSQAYKRGHQCMVLRSRR